MIAKSDLSMNKGSSVRPHFLFKKIKLKVDYLWMRINSEALSCNVQLAGVCQHAGIAALKGNSIIAIGPVIQITFCARAILYTARKLRVHALWFLTGGSNLDFDALSSML
jgi:hypothetical protein